MFPVHLATAFSVAIVVSQTPEASDCPSTSRFVTEVTRITGKTATETIEGASSVVRVDFSRRGRTYLARVQLQGEREGERALQDEGETCDALAEAASITTALLVDPSAQLTRSSDARKDNAPEWFELWVEGRIGAGLGLVSGPNGSLGGAIDASLGQLTSLGIALAFTSPHETSLGAGRVAARLWFVEASAFRSLTGPSFRLGPSLTVMAGEMHGVGAGYPMSSSASLPWFAFGAGVRADVSLGSRFRLGARALVVLPTRKPSFSVGYVGALEESSSVAGTAEFVAGLRFW